MVFLLAMAGREGIGMAGKAVNEVEGAVEDLGMVEHAFEIGCAAPALSGAAEQLQQDVDRKADEKKGGDAHAQTPSRATRDSSQFYIFAEDI